ncbi:hypothetical protein K1J57_02040 [Nocardiopsis sp. MT53]|uniref:hypothetical protein n=1 Tax=Nocardiopsis sp. MT53 TaxID=2865672 RepID=UPI001C72A44D|nr:hypothetical protein [Nocardiopsis sp. MT53]QYX37502.1 hypothetical protein K1J57_02040 [Nocardiopsis sp. MT53]
MEVPQYTGPSGCAGRERVATGWIACGRLSSNTAVMAGSGVEHSSCTGCTGRNGSRRATSAGRSRSTRRMGAQYARNDTVGAYEPMCWRTEVGMVSSPDTVLSQAPASRWRGSSADSAATMPGGRYGAR